MTAARRSEGRQRLGATAAFAIACSQQTCPAQTLSACQKVARQKPRRQGGPSGKGARAPLTGRCQQRGWRRGPAGRPARVIGGGGGAFACCRPALFIEKARTHCNARVTPTPTSNCMQGGKEAGATPNPNSHAAAPESARRARSSPYLPSAPEQRERRGGEEAAHERAEHLFEGGRQKR